MAALMVDLVVLKTREGREALLKKRSRAPGPWSPPRILHLVFTAEVEYVVAAANAVEPLITIIEEQRNALGNALDWLRAAQNPAIDDLIRRIEGLVEEKP